MKMEQATAGNLVMSLMFVIVLLTIPMMCESSEDTGVCPGGCNCTLGKVECEKIAKFPNITGADSIHSLSINKHNITQLKKGDLDNFIHLEQLYMNSGMLTTIAPGSFEAVGDTIKLIDFMSNVINTLEAGVFANLKNLDKIVLNSNHLSTLKANSFVNMSKLTNLLILSNSLETVHKEAFKGLPELKTLNLFNNHLKEIPFESFTKLSALQLLILTRNEIKAIPEQTKAILPALEDIYLDSNPISQMRVFPNISNSLKRVELDFTDISAVTKDTWKYISQLEHLNIGGTKFRVISAGTFEGLPNLQKLLLRDMQLLTSVGPDAFRGLKNAVSIDLADCKKLQTIDETAFMSTAVTSFFLKGSGVTYLPKNLFKWWNMKTVSIDGNPINCDCKVKWMLNSSIYGDNTNVQDSFKNLVCATPKFLSGMKVLSVNPANLICKPLPESHSSRFATGIIIAVICFIFMTTVALLTKYRKRISSSCRRYYQYRRYKNDLVFTVEHDTSIAELEDTDGHEGRPLKDMRLETSIET